MILASERFESRPVPDRPVASPVDAGRLELSLFVFALAVYIASRFAGLTRYPAFFFGDEALQGNLAEMLLHNHFRDQTGTLLPPYFLNDQRWAVSLSVYIHLIPVWLFGKTVATIRATSAAVSVLAAVGTALALRVGVKSRFWWSAPLVLAVIPVFFVHARLGFETEMMASFFACFLWAYFLYRFRSPKYLYLALLFGAATFYAYTGGQGVMLVTGAVLLLSDAGYHWRQKWTLWLGGLALAVLLAIPYLRYRSLHPGVVRQQLAVLDSYWTHPIPTSQKLQIFAHTYVQGLAPRYWFWLNGEEVARHRMDDLGFLPRVYLPLCAVGLLVCLWNFRSSAHRAVFFSPLGVPFAAAVASLQILRLMAMVVPVTLLVVIALDQLYRWTRRFLPYTPVALALAAGLAVSTTILTAQALTKGATWFRDYGLYGMQWGAEQVYKAVRSELRRSPQTQFLISSTWANNPQEFEQFFLTPQERERVSIADIYAYDRRKTPMTGRELFVMTSPEYELARGSGKFVLSPPDLVIAYPDGRPGFYFVRLRYSAQAEQVFQKERELRARLVEEAIPLGGESVTVRHSRLDMGALPSLFDGNPATLVRGEEANPFVLELLFPTPHPIAGIALTLGTMDLVELHIIAVPESGVPVSHTTSFPNRPARPSVEYLFPEGRLAVRRLRLEIKDTGREISNIEVRELSLR